MQHLDPVPASLVRRCATSLVAVLVALGTMLTMVGLASAPAHADPQMTQETPALPATVTADALPTWQLNGVVWSQAVVGNTVYVTGSFTAARPPGVPAGGAGQVPANNIFAFDITTGNPVPFNHSLNAQGLVIRASADGTELYVGGDFTAVDGQPRGHIAAFNLPSGTLSSTFAPNTDGQVRAFGVTAQTLYVGGNFRSANGQARNLLAAFSTSSGAMSAWSPSVGGGYVWAMVMSPDNSRVIAGGSFTTINGVSAYGMGSVNATSGDVDPWAATARIRTAGANGAITSLSTDGSQVYGSGYAFGSGASFEGTFAADPYTGDINWVNDCLGDTYDTFPIGQVLYSVSHHHDCSVVGGFTDTKPRNRWQKATAAPTFPTGMITRKDAYGWNFTGLPYAGLLHWYPNLAFGSYTPDRQAAWSVTGNADYIVLGGEFPTVNGIAQQDLVRFAKRPIAPDAMGPIYNTGFNPVAIPTTAGTVKVLFGSLWDRDDSTIAYDVFRNGGAKIATITRDDGEFWSLPQLTFTDTGLTPGTQVRYQIRARDPHGNSQWSSYSSYVAVSATPASSYAASVAASSPSHYWRLGESSGWLLDSVGDAHGTATGLTQGAAGAVIGDTDAAIGSPGGSTAKMTTTAQLSADASVSVEGWVKTTSSRGGRIVGFGDQSTGTSSSGNTDRVLYLDNSGRVNFASNDGAYRTIYSPKAINDGQWHQVVGMVDANGLQLFVDGRRVARDQRYTSPKIYAGYWRIGADQTSGLANRPTDAGLAGSIDEVAVYPRALTVSEVQVHYTSSGRSGGWSATPTDAYGSAVVADGPDLYWRLGEAGGPALDSSANGVDGSVTGGITRGVDGAIAGDSAATFDGVSGLVVAPESWSSPTTFTAELWFKTSSTRGGKLVGFGNAASGTSGSYDRHVYMYSNGKLSFGVNNGTQTSIVTPASYNDGQWHYLVASQGPDGMRLWVDAEFVGTNAATTGQSYLGYWRIGGDKTWGNTQSNYINATLDEVAVYPVVLTATDIRNHYVAAGRPAPNQPPVAAFTDVTTNLRVDVDGSGSSDPDGSVASYAWDFGDGSTGTGKTASHTYAQAGSYDVKLTVTDNDGATDSVTHAVTVASPVGLAHDEFSRTQTGGWGTADVGGPWTIATGASKYSVGDGTGKVNLAAGSGYTGSLTQVSSSSTDLRVSVNLDQTATGGGTYVSLIGRQVAGVGDYRAKARIAANGSVVIWLTRTINGTETALASTTVPGVTITGQDVLDLRVVVTGTGTTTITAKAWATGTTEPSAWTVSTTDTTPSLQSSGSIGLYSYVSGSATRPVVLSYDNLDATPAGG